MSPTSAIAQSTTDHHQSSRSSTTLNSTSSHQYSFVVPDTALVEAYDKFESPITARAF